MNQLWRLLKSLFKIKWRLTPPKSSKVLLYFKTGADVIAPYFKPNEFQILDLRESEVNLWVAFKCLINRDLSARNYARQFIKKVQPKLVLTFIDNYPPFYALKQDFPEIKTLLIQNGYRSDRGDLFGLLATEYSKQQNMVDQLFVFGEAVGSKYRQHISGNVTVHGSFKNNSVLLTQAPENSVAYISTYRPRVSRSFVVPESSPELLITYGEVIARRETAILWLANYCAEKNRPLKIIGKDENLAAEEDYYKGLLRKFEFEFVGKKSSETSYEAIDKSEIVVFTSSTLGYESLARGKKTAAIMLDAQLIKADALKFGWPAGLADEGKFWTHQLSQQRIYEIMDYLINTTDAEWNETRLEAIKDVIEFDPGNSKFVSVIDSILAT